MTTQIVEAGTRDIVLVGGSAGSISAIKTILKSIPKDLPATLFIVVHTLAEAPGLLAQVLARTSKFPVKYAVDGEQFERGVAYLAPTDMHLAIKAHDRIAIRKGPRENRVRPAVDPLFRSAATHGYGTRSIAVVLSGVLDDGSAGLYALRKRGGVAIVQSPKDATYSDMPSNALQHAGADYVLPAAKIAGRLIEIVKPHGKELAMKNPAQTHRGETNPAEDSPNSLVAAPEESHEGTPSAFACPECHGVLWEIKEGGSVRYRCRTGHAYTELALNDELSNAGEVALWAAMRALQEKAAMSRRLADSKSDGGSYKARLEEQASAYAEHAELLRKMVLGERLTIEEKEPLLDRKAG